MKIIIEKPLSECSFRATLFDRTGIKQSIIDWGKTPGRFAHGAIYTENGIVVEVSEFCGRIDIAEIEFTEQPNSKMLFHVFLHYNRTHSNPLNFDWTNNSNPLNFDWTNNLSDSDFEHFTFVCLNWFEQNADYVARQNRWFISKPWNNIKVGMTCDEAVAILSDLGW